MIRRSAALSLALVVGMLAGVAIGTAASAATWTVASAGDCSVPATHADPTAQASSPTQLRAHIDAPRRAIARAGAHSELAPCRSATADRVAATHVVALDAAAAPKANGIRAVGDRAPPS